MNNPLLLLFGVILALFALSPNFGGKPAAPEPYDLSMFDGQPSTVIGDPDAPITIIEFTSYYCPACRHSAPQIKEYVRQHPDTRVLVFVDTDSYPDLSYEAARRGKFERFHNAIMNHRGRLSRDVVYQIAQRQGVPVSTRQSPHAKIYQAKVRDVKRDFRIRAWPTYIVANTGGRISGWKGIEHIDQMVDVARQL